MGKSYTMKDLGYQRTPTSAEYRIEMPDGSEWAVPVQIIADSRDEHYADDKEDTVGFIKDGSLDEYEISNWASGNMNWSDVDRWARKLPAKSQVVDYQEGWVNGSHYIEGL